MESKDSMATDESSHATSCIDERREYFIYLLAHKMHKKVAHPLEIHEKFTRKGPGRESFWTGDY